MCTKWFSDGDVHKYFNPYDTPYEAFINYMNILSDFTIRLNKEINGKNNLPQFENIEKIIEEAKNVDNETKIIEKVKPKKKSNTLKKTKEVSKEKKSTKKQKKNKKK